MIQIGIAAEFTFQTTDGDAERDEAFDRIMDELVKLADADCGISDPALAVDLDARTVLVEIVVEAEDFDAAVAVGDSSARTAFHAAGWRAELVEA